MMIGVIGLGLIGGSMAKALNQSNEHTVYGYDIEESVIRRAILLEAIEGGLTEEMLPECDMIIVALWPEAAVQYIQEHAPAFKKDAIVVDTCGVKRKVCGPLFPLAQQYGFRFFGGHPMAGMAHSGFSHAKKALFDRASMVLVPPEGVTIETLEQVKQIFLSIGFTHIQITTAEEHDQMIAFTSQLAHVVSSAYIKSPVAKSHDGFSAGSYRDLTRVAKLDENMWTELFLDNPDFLSKEIETLAGRLLEYSVAIRQGDAGTLRQLLREGREEKERIDKERF